MCVRDLIFPASVGFTVLLCAFGATPHGIRFGQGRAFQSALRRVRAAFDVGSPTDPGRRAAQWVVRAGEHHAPRAQCREARAAGRPCVGTPPSPACPVRQLFPAGPAGASSSAAVTSVPVRTGPPGCPHSAECIRSRGRSCDGPAVAKRARPQAESAAAVPPRAVLALYDAIRGEAAAAMGTGGAELARPAAPDDADTGDKSEKERCATAAAAAKRARAHTHSPTHPHTHPLTHPNVCTATRPTHHTRSTPLDEWQSLHERST
jgi:hypothetical protein